VPVISPTSSWLGPLDWAVVAFYSGGLIILGVLASRRHFAPVDYFLASRGTTWSVIGLSLFATNISSTALVGLTGGAYSTGLSVYDYEWSATLVLVFFCLFLLPSIIRSRIYTMPEYLERRYDRRARLLFALLTLFLNVVVDSAGVLYSGSLVCQLLFPAWPLWLIVTVLAGGAGIYTITGGLRSVIYTEAVQAVVLLASAALISVVAFHRAGGWHAVMTQVDPAALSLIRPLGDRGVPWLGLLCGVPLLGFYYWCTNQSIVQRMLSAKDTDHARWGALFAGLLKLTVLFLIVLPGTCALLLFPHLPRADLVYPNLILHLLPVGLAGLVVAAFVAATIVAIASLLNSASTLITMDVVRHFRPNLPDHKIVRIGRISTAVLLVVTVAWAPQLQLFPSLWQYLQAVLAYVVPPVVALFVVGMFWRGANADGAAVTLIVGSLCGGAMFLANGVLHWTHLHFLYAAPILTLIDIGILVGVSAHTATVQRASQMDAMSPLLSWRVDRADSSARPFWQDYRWQAAGLVLLTAAVVISFR
jgi:solute:Na+ symporter, SSS family